MRRVRPRGLAYALAVVAVAAALWPLITSYARASDVAQALGLVAPGSRLLGAGAASRDLGAPARALGPALWRRVSCGSRRTGSAGRAARRSPAASGWCSRRCFAALLLHLALRRPRRPGRGPAYAVAAARRVGLALFRDPFEDEHCWSNCTDNVLPRARRISVPPACADRAVGRLRDRARAGARRDGGPPARERERDAGARYGRGSRRTPRGRCARRRMRWRCRSPWRIRRATGFAALFLVRAAALTAASPRARVASRRARAARAPRSRASPPSSRRPRAAARRPRRAPSATRGCEVAYPLPGSDRTVDARGQPAGARRRGRALTRIVRDGRPVAIVAHDAALLDGAELEREIGAAARLAVDNERLRGRACCAQLDDLRASRARIVETRRRRAAPARARPARRRAAAAARALLRAAPRARRGRDGAPSSRRARLRPATRRRRRSTSCASSRTASTRRSSPRRGSGRHSRRSPRPAPLAGRDRRHRRERLAGRSRPPPTSSSRRSSRTPPRGATTSRSAPCARTDGLARDRVADDGGAPAPACVHARRPRRRARRPRSTRAAGDAARRRSRARSRRRRRDAHARGHRAAARRRRRRGRRRGRGRRRLLRAGAAHTARRRDRRHPDAADPHRRGPRRRPADPRRAPRRSACSCSRSYVEPRYALRLLEEHPERVGYLLKERVFDVAILVDALRRLADGEMRDRPDDRRAARRAAAPARPARGAHRPRARGRSRSSPKGSPTARSRRAWSSPSGPSRRTSSRSSSSSASAPTRPRTGACSPCSCTCVRSSDRLARLPQASAVLRRLARVRQPVRRALGAVVPAAARAATSAEPSQTIVSAPCSGVRSSGFSARWKPGSDVASPGVSTQPGCIACTADAALGPHRREDHLGALGPRVHLGAAVRPRDGLQVVRRPAAPCTSRRR